MTAVSCAFISNPVAAAYVADGFVAGTLSSWTGRTSLKPKRRGWKVVWLLLWSSSTMRAEAGSIGRHPGFEKAK